MVKIHTKQKRMARSPTHLKSIKNDTRNRKKRPRTFKTEEAAKKWAEKNNIKKYELKNIRPEYKKDKKIKVVEL